MGRKGLSAPGQAGQAVTLRSQSWPSSWAAVPILWAPSWPVALRSHRSICPHLALFVWMCMFSPFHLQPLISEFVNKQGAESHLETFSEALFGKEFLALHCFHRPEEDRQRHKKRGHAPKSINLGFDNTAIKSQSYPLWGGFRNMQLHRDFSWQTSECPLASQATRHREMKSSPRAEAHVPPPPPHQWRAWLHQQELTRLCSPTSDLGAEPEVPREAQALLASCFLCWDPIGMKDWNGLFMKALAKLAFIFL